MTEPIKLPPIPEHEFLFRDDLLAYARLAVEQATAGLRAEVDKLRLLGERVNGIRNSIIGAQAVNFSEHVYPLVAALNEAGFVGKNYDEARKDLGTLIEQVKKAEAERDEARAELARLTTLRPIPEYGDFPQPAIYWSNDGDGWMVDDDIDGTHWTPLPEPKEADK